MTDTKNEHIDPRRILHQYAGLVSTALHDAGIYPSPLLSATLLAMGCAMFVDSGNTTQELVTHLRHIADNYEAGKLVHK